MSAWVIILMIWIAPAILVGVALLWTLSGRLRRGSEKQNGSQRARLEQELSGTSLVAEKDAASSDIRPRAQQRQNAR